MLPEARSLSISFCFAEQFDHRRVAMNQLVAQQMATNLRELSEVEDMARLGFALYDYYGTLRPLNEVLEERRSEVADNEAGKEVGQILGEAIDRKISYEQARDRIFKLLCDY